MKFLLFTFNFVFVVCGWEVRWRVSRLLTSASAAQQAIGATLMGLGTYILVQAKSWHQIVATPDAGAVLVVIVGLVTFVIAFFGCCGASQESQCMLSTYAIIVGLVFVAEIAAAILLLLYTREVGWTACVFLLSQQSFFVHLLSFFRVGSVVRTPFASGILA